MYDLFLLRGRGIETMLGISPFEIDEFQTFAAPPQTDITNDNKKSPIPPFQSEALKDKTERTKNAPENKLICFEPATTLVVIIFTTFALVCFLLVALLD